MQVIAKFMALMYSFLNISLSQNIVPDEIKGREFHNSFPMTLFVVWIFTDVDQFCSCFDIIPPNIKFREKAIGDNLEIIPNVCETGREYN